MPLSFSFCLLFPTFQALLASFSLPSTLCRSSCVSSPGPSFAVHFSIETTACWRLSNYRRDRRGLDGCRMLMSEPRHWASRSREEGGLRGDMRLYQSDTCCQNMRSLKGDPFQWLRSSLLQVTHLSKSKHLLRGCVRRLTPKAFCTWAYDDHFDT